VTLWVDDYIKEQASKDYRFGDISRRIVQLIRQQQQTLSEEQLADAYLALRYLVSAGIMITPLTSLLPFRGLVALLNFGLQERVSTRVLEVVATAVEVRIQKALDNSSSTAAGCSIHDTTTALGCDEEYDNRENDNERSCGERTYARAIVTSRPAFYNGDHQSETRFEQVRLRRHDTGRSGTTTTTKPSNNETDRQ
jgi:hypothetical protein